TIPAVYRFRWTNGNDASVRALGGSQAIVRGNWAKQHGIAIGDTVSILTPAGKRVGLTVAGLYDPAKLDNLLGHVLIPHRVFERTREIGMLRAVGLTRRQARRMIRRESIITALIGASLGIPLGLGLAAAVTHALAPYGVTFSLPLGSLAVFIGIAIWAGTLA